jgi:hypothetical protein
MPVESGTCAFFSFQRAYFLQFLDRGGIIMQNAELQRKLCVSEVMIFYISIGKLYSIFEGGLLCIRN